MNLNYKRVFKIFLGGCGAIFEVFISTTEFKGMSMVKQHQLINEVSMHLIVIDIYYKPEMYTEKSSKRCVYKYIQFQINLK